MPVAKRSAPRPQPAPGNGRHPDDDLAAERRFGTGRYVVIADYVVMHGGGWSSRVVRQYESRARAIKHAALAAVRMRGHVRVECWPERWHSGDRRGHMPGDRAGGEVVVREFGGPSPALAEFALERLPDEGQNRGKRLPAAERDRRVRAVCRVLADAPRNTHTLATHVGYGRSGLNGVLAWGEDAGLWRRNKGTNRWSLLPTGWAVVAGGELP